MKIKIDIEIDTKEDMNEITDMVELITEFRDKLIELQDYDD
jgi:hypothetical protein